MVRFVIPLITVYLYKDEVKIMAVLDVEGLTMSYADKKLYEDASFQLEKHEHMGIVGQNGAGKSTLIKILIGKVLPVDGSVKIGRAHV